MKPQTCYRCKNCDYAVIMKRFISKLSGVGGKEMKRGQTLTGESSICFCWDGGGKKVGWVTVVSVTGVKGEESGGCGLV